MGTQGYIASAGIAAGGSELLPIDPFRSLAVHFGMLLGVEDFRVLDAYHRGKSWYHAAWLHGQGVIWGLGTEFERGTPPEGATEGPLTGELRVAPGAALDARGRELSLPQAACVDIPAWYAAHRDDPEMATARTVDDATGVVSLDAHVVIAFDACLDRQVPALTEPCGGGGSTTAYSRVVETVRLTLRPGPAPDWRAEAPGRFSRVRLLLGLEPPEDDPESPGTPTEAAQAVLDARAEIAALPETDRPAATLDRMRRFAVLDEIAMAPRQADADSGWNILPVPPPAEVVLAELTGIRLAPAEGGFTLETAEVDPFVRPVHLPTSTIQDLVAGTLPIASAAPQIDSASVALAGATLTFRTDGPALLPDSLTAAAVAVGAFVTGTGWSDIAVASLAYEAGTSIVTVTLADAPTGDVVRLIVRGTGTAPVLGDGFVPLAGATGSPAAPGGSDFVHQIMGVS